MVKSFTRWMLLACAVAALPAQAGDWTLRVDGVGPLKVGMRFDTVNKILHDNMQRVPKAARPRADCFQVEPSSEPGVLLTFIKDQLKRVDVMEEGTPSDRGIALGDPVAKVTQTYGEAARATSGQLIVKAGADQYAIRFEVSEGKIDAMYGGEWDAVQHPKACQWK